MIYVPALIFIYEDQDLGPPKHFAYCQKCHEKVHEFKKPGIVSLMDVRCPSCGATSNTKFETDRVWKPKITKRKGPCPLCHKQS